MTTAAGAPDGAIDGTIVRSVDITNQKGLHARAAAKLAQMAGQFQAEITVGRAGVTVSDMPLSRIKR